VLTLLTYWRYRLIRFAWFVSLCFPERKAAIETITILSVSVIQRTCVTSIWGDSASQLFNSESLSVQYPILFGSAKVASFINLTTLKWKNFKIFSFNSWVRLLPVETGRNGTVVFLVCKGLKKWIFEPCCGPQRVDKLTRAEVPRLLKILSSFYFKLSHGPFDVLGLQR